MAGKMQRCYKCIPAVGYEFEGDRPECPVCNATPPHVVTLQLVHWLVGQKDGPIQGTHGRYRVACQPGRTHLMNLPASDSPAAVSCPLCKAAEGHAGLLAEYAELNGR